MELKVSLGNWDSLTPYGIGACNTNSMGSGVHQLDQLHHPLGAANTPNGLPIINPACAVVTSYRRSQPTRITHSLGDAADAKLQHQEHRDEWRFPLYPGER
jgi:hypothetical protein